MAQVKSEVEVVSTVEAEECKESVSPFGDDDDDSGRGNDQSSSGKSSNGNVAHRESLKSDDLPFVKSFGRATFSRNPIGLERLKSVGDGQDDPQTNNAVEQPEEPSTPMQELQESPVISSYITYAAQKQGRRKSVVSYCCAPLAQPLTHLKEKSDYLAALASWVTILRIMGDLPDMDDNNLSIPGTSPAITRKVRSYYQKKYTKKDVDDAHKKYTEMFKDLSNSTFVDIPFLSAVKESMLDKVQFICALGIYRADLRDEIYCQVCKQLTNNPSRNSTIRGWVLLQVLAGCFAPTELFSSVFLQFLQDSPPELSEVVIRQLRRTFAVGTRGFPPSWLEFQAIKNGKPILLPISMMNGQRVLVKTDSATTVKEICSQIAQKYNLKEYMGYSLYITLTHKVSCLGSGVHRVMDAIAECEQHTKQVGMKESSAAWRLYFRREHFMPWHDPREDMVTTGLDYEQIMRGVTVSEYKCEKEEIIALMAAQKLYVDNLNNPEEKSMEKFLKKFLPDSHRHDDISKWVDAVNKCLEENIKKRNPSQDALKVDTVTFAKHHWHTVFSRFYDAEKFEGPQRSLTNVLVGVNFAGVDIMDDNEKVKHHCDFVEFGIFTRYRKCIKVKTIYGENYSFYCYHSEDFYLMVKQCVHNLTLRSKYAIVTQEYRSLEASSGGNVSKGDLVILDKTNEETLDDDVLTGVCKKSGKRVSLPKDVIYILPTIQEPTAKSMDRITVEVNRDPALFPAASSKLYKYTLETFARHNFRLATESSVTKLLSKASLKKEKSGPLWAYSKEPLKKPLLKRTCARDDLKKAGVTCFQAIQQYMGDIPIKENITDTSLVNDLILEPAIRSKYLRDEIFCQVLKQLTDSQNKSGEERGWFLLLLLSSCAAPSSDLMEECRNFMTSRNHRFNKLCRERMERLKRDGNRIYPPHLLEHDSLNKRKQIIRIKVIFPNKTAENFDVSAITKVFELKDEIAQRLGLTHTEEYSVFVGMNDRVISIDEDSYLFDALNHSTQCWTRQPEKRRSSTSGEAMMPGVIFMRKLWVNATPSKEPKADLMFHFPQELQNYLRGYHLCTRMEAVSLSALVFYALYAGEEKEVKSVSSLNKILPADLLPMKSVQEWTQEVNNEIRKLGTVSSDEAKVWFLRSLSTFQTYGSVFFEAKLKKKDSTAVPTSVSIGKNGILLIDIASKTVVEVIKYDKIPNWYFDERTFTFVIGDSKKTAKILLETSVGHNMDDMIISYIAWHMESHIKQRHRYAGMNIGESVC